MPQASTSANYCYAISRNATPTKTLLPGEGPIQLSSNARLSRICYKRVPFTALGEYGSTRWVRSRGPSDGGLALEDDQARYLGPVCFAYVQH